MNTETLKKLGLKDEQIKGVMADYGKVVNPLKEQVNQLTADRDGLKGQLDTASKQLTDLQDKHQSDSDLQAEIGKLKQANKEAQESHKQELTNAKKSYLTDMALTKAGAKNVTAVKALLKSDDLKIDDNGKLSGLDEQIKTLESNDDTSFLFKSAESAKPDTPRISTDGNPNPDITSSDSMTAKIAARLAGDKG